MRLVLTGLLAAVTASLLAALGGGAAAAAVRCAPVGAQVKLADSRAQVYALRQAIYGCDRGTRRTTKLGQTTTCVASARVDHLALAGDVVAYGLDRCGVDTGSASITVRRLSDGKRLHSFAALTGAGPESYQSVTSLVVKPDGSVAWIATVHSIIVTSEGGAPEVHANGKLLEAGEIELHSLRLHGSTLTWRDGAGKKRSATLR